MSNNPFPGLRAFKQEETRLFFGRDGQSEQLLKRLQDSRFLALVGVSGSGKSSLIRAGLLPKLDGGLMSAVDSDWRVAVFRPGNNPIRNMAHALVTEAGLGGDSGFEEVEIAIAETTLRRGNLGLLELVKQAKRKVRENGQPFLGPNENVLVVVDQFEEIFRIIEQYDELVRVKQLSAGNSDAAATAVADDLESHPREEASAFVKLLLESTKRNKANKYHENVYIIVTMRSDYLGDTAQFGGMPERINEGQYLIPRMDRDERRKAIVGPIAVAGGSITEPLVNQLLNDAGEDPRRLPILQHALMRMWEVAERAPQNGGLNLEHYERIEKLSGALSQHANEAFNELSNKHQELTAKIFKCLTEKGLANREIRRPMKIADICAVVEAKEEDVKTVVDCFRKNGRWFLMPPQHDKPQLTSDTLIDISHESLISGWDKLRAWVNEEAESARTYKRLADTAILKELGKEDFYRGPALQLALKWRDDNTPNPAWARRYHPEFDKAIAFLDSSLKDTQKREQAERDRTARELRRTRTYNIILGILAAMFLVLGVFFVGLQRRMSNNEVAREKERAENAARQTTLAEAGEKKAKGLQEQADEARKQAEAGEKRAKELRQQALDSLNKERVAVTAARKAEAVAIAERKKAEDLQTEIKEQATTNEYFKTAFGHVAARDFDKAAGSLEKALAYYVDKEKRATTNQEKQAHKDNQFSTLINIGDVYRSAEEDVQALETYDNALELIGTDNTERRAQALTKAGSVWKDSEESSEARSAAKYYEDAAKVYGALDQKTNVSNTLLEAGRIRARFLTNSTQVNTAIDDFREAVKALGTNVSLTAAANAEIGEIYLKLVTKDTEGDEDDEDPVSSAESPPRELTSNESELASEPAQNRARETGASFFRTAANEYASLGEEEKAAEMKKQIGVILSGNNRELENARIAFDDAATSYARMGNKEKQKDLLFAAGGIFVESKDPFGKRLADYFYQQVVDLATSNEEKVIVLTDIAESYETATDLTVRQRAVDYYKRASELYRQMNRRRDEAAALISAGTVLRDFNDQESTTKTTQLFEQAIAVHQDDPKEQARTLKYIGDSYANSEQPVKKEQAIDYYRRAANVAKPVDKTEELNALLQAGRTLIRLERAGAQEQATTFFDEAVNAYPGDINRQTAILGRIALLYANTDPPQKQKALAYYDRAIVLAHDQKDKLAEVNAIFAKARGIPRFDDPDSQRQIEQLYTRAVEVYNDDPAKQVETLVRIGRLVYVPREPSRIVKAEQYFNQALKLAKAQADKTIEGYAYLNIGLAYQTSQRAKAEEYYRTALMNYERAGDQYGRAMTLYRLIAVDRRQAVDLANRALPLFASALPELQASGDQRKLLDAYYAMGSMLFRQKKDYRAAMDSFNKALQICKTLPDQASRITVINSQIRSVQRAIDQGSK